MVRVSTQAIKAIGVPRSMHRSCRRVRASSRANSAPLRGDDHLSRKPMPGSALSIVVHECPICKKAHRWLRSLVATGLAQRSAGRRRIAARGQRLGDGSLHFAAVVARDGAAPERTPRGQTVP